jgi:hypothetical protein
VGEELARQRSPSSSSEPITSEPARKSFRPFCRPRSTIAALRRDLEFAGIQLINDTNPRMQLGGDRQKTRQAITGRGTGIWSWQRRTSKTGDEDRVPAHVRHARYPDRGRAVY